MNNNELVKDVYEIFERIKNTAGKNHKIEIVRQNSDNENFKFFLSFLYDDMITTGLSKKKIGKNIKTKGATTIRGFSTPESIMNHLTEFNTGTDKIILSVQTYLKMLEEPYREFMSEVLTKSYKCGVTATSVNKAIPKHIRQFKVQLAHPYEKYADKISGEFTLTQKLDGHRTLAEVDSSGEVVFRTRKGHPINGMIELEEDFSKFFASASGKGIMIDGEIVASDKGIPIEDAFQETSKIIRKDGEKTGLTFHVFDSIPLIDFWEDGKSFAVYSERRNAMENYFKSSSYKPEHIELVENLYTGSDKEVITDIMSEATDKGWEGIMLNLSDEPYSCKRTKGLLKVKKFYTDDLEVTGTFEGTGKYEGMLGGVYVDYKGNRVGVGSGFTDEQREYYWNNKKEIVGSIVEVTYFEETTNQKDDEISLRFPIFKSVRTDKTVEDINYES